MIMTMIMFKHIIIFVIIYFLIDVVFDVIIYVILYHFSLLDLVTNLCSGSYSQRQNSVPVSSKMSIL
jgi:hypothetical protein